MAPSAFAHPLGNYSTNQYWTVDMQGDEFRIYFQLDIAEIPSFKEMDLLDTDLDTKASEEEINAYVPQRVAQIIPGLEVEYGGKKWPLKVTRQSLSLYKGSEDMLAFSIEVDLTVEGWKWPDGDSVSEIVVKSTLHENSRGYREAYVLLNGRYSIDPGPWEDDEFRYITLATEDDKKNLLFQSFYNIFRIRLSEGPKSIDSKNRTPVDFNWTATARSKTDEIELVGTYNVPIAPQKNDSKVSGSEK